MLGRYTFTFNRPPQFQSTNLKSTIIMIHDLAILRFTSNNSIFPFCIGLGVLLGQGQGQGPGLDKYDLSLGLGLRNSQQEPTVALGTPSKNKNVIFSDIVQKGRS